MYLFFISKRAGDDVIISWRRSNRTKYDIYVISAAADNQNG